MEDQSYLAVLKDSLEKKIKVLEKIQDKNEEQIQILTEETVSLDKWKASAEEKSDLIDQINFLDEGFQEVYNRVSEELQNNQNRYKYQIGKFQQLISRITDLTVTIQTQEARNKQLAQQQFATFKKQGIQMKQSQKALNVYQNSMKHLNVIEPQFLDQKK